MRGLMGLIKDRHGTYYAQRKVPERFQAAVARVLGSKRRTLVFLKKSLGTKDLKAAHIRGKLVLAEFDRTLGAAMALASPAPAATVREKISATEIARMAEYVFAKQLAHDERFRVGRRGKSVQTSGTSAVGDGDAVGIARQIGQYGLWPAERALGIDHPFDAAQWGEIRGERLCVSEGGVVAEELQAAGFVGCDQRLQEQSAEQTREHA